MGNYLKRVTGWGTGQLGRVLDARIRAMVHWRSKLELPLGAEQSRARRTRARTRARANDEDENENENENDDADDDDYVTPKTTETKT